MPTFPSRPLVRPRDDGLQLSYQIPHRVYTAKSYPVHAPNGSTIIIYGYQNGLKVIWRGGRRFSANKTPTPTKSKPQGDEDAVMIIDSDEETSPQPQKEEEPSYVLEDEEPEVDPAHPYEAILHQVDVPLGSRVLELAVPSLLPETARSSLEPFPPILKKSMLVSVICADYSTRVVTIPLAPPHPTQSQASIGIKELSIGGVVSHHEVPRGVSMTFTYQEGKKQEEDKDLSRSRTFSRKADGTGAGRWELLVATHSAESSGLLLVHRIPIAEDEGGVHRIDEDSVESKRRYLPTPAKNIVFNPSSYPSSRHATLLVSFPSGCAKIYSCFYTKESRASRRTAGQQNDSETSGMEGKWLISLYPGFEQSLSGVAQRKTIVDAEWVLGGRAVMVLMADGEWGIWDIEGAGPGSSKGPLQRQSSVQGVTGGSLAAFSVSGRILSPLPVGHQTDTPGLSAEQRPRFAPLTPSTKRLREDTLLKGGAGSAPTPSLCGEISVYQTNSYKDSLPDESILLRHGNHCAIIPSLLSLWRNAIKASGTFDASNRCRVSAIQDITLLGENLKGITHLLAPTGASRGSKGPEFNTMLTTEHMILILAPRLCEQEAAPAPIINVTSTAETDQLMLQRGELDVNGMDRLLSGMGGGNRSLHMGSPIKKARIFS